MSTAAYSSVQDAIQGLKDRGFTVDLEFQGEAVHAMHSGTRFTPEEMTIVEHHRFEGASDPDDMAVVYAIECQDGTRGTLVDAFGVYADSGLAEFLKNVRMREAV
jgi:hypothetical protein